MEQLRYSAYDHLSRRVLKNTPTATHTYDYDAAGCRRDIRVTESSDHPAITNSVTRHDFLGRATEAATPLSCSAYAYDGASSRIVTAADSKTGVVTVWMVC